MLKKVLSEIDLYTGKIETPKGFEIDRKTIKNSILPNYSSKEASSRDCKVDYSPPLQWLQDYIRDHWREAYGKSLFPRRMWGIVLQPNEESPLRHTVEPLDLINSPDYTFIYGIDVPEKDCECVIHYDKNRRANKTWHIPLKNNKFIMFPSTQKFYISKNTSEQLITLLTITYGYIE
jgi:hypothetical protein